MIIDFKANTALLLLLFSFPSLAQDAVGENLTKMPNFIFDPKICRRIICFILHCRRFSEKGDCEEAWKYVEFLKMDVTETVNTILQVMTVMIMTMMMMMVMVMVMVMVARSGRGWQCLLKVLHGDT